MWNGVLCALLAGAMWGMVFIVPELLPAFSALELALGRYSAYGAIALGLMLARLPDLFKRLERSDCGALLRHALAGNIVYYMLLATAVRMAGVAPASLIIGVLPIAITLMGRKDHGALPMRALALPLLVVGAGIACINIDLFTQSRGSSAALSDTVFGLLAALGALLCWSWYGLDNARYLKRHRHFSNAEWSALYGMASGLVALLIGAFMLISGIGLRMGVESDPATAALARDWSAFWIINAALALGASVLGNHLWNIASRRVPVTLAGQLILFETLFALLYGYLYHQRLPRPLESAAMLLLVAGVGWSVRVHSQKSASH